MNQLSVYNSDNLLMKTLWMMLAIFSTGFTSFAIERFETYNGVRAMGMGGAYVGVVNDETALIQNPAALGKLRDGFVTIVDPEISVSGDFTEEVLNGSDISSLFEPQGIVDSLSNQADKPLHSQYQIFPSIVGPNFGVGLHVKKSVNGLGDATGANVHIEYFEDTALYLGYNFRIWEGRIKFGFAGKYLNRAYFGADFVSGDANVSVTNNVSEGAGVGLDAGLILTAPWKWLPSIAAVVHDVGGTKMDYASGLNYSTPNRPPTLKQKIDAAFSMFPIHGNKTRSSITFEIKDVLNVDEEEDANRRYHFGYEFNLYDLLFLRAGYNQRYWTAGIEFAMENLQFQVASYGEDVGADNSPIEDRRYILKFAFRF